MPSKQAIKRQCTATGTEFRVRTSNHIRVGASAFRGTHPTDRRTEETTFGSMKLERAVDDTREGVQQTLACLEARVRAQESKRCGRLEMGS